MTQWQQFNSREKALTEALFVTRSILDGDREENEPDHKVSFSELYQQATQPNRSLTLELQQALVRDKKLRDGFHLLLQKTAHYHLPRAAAASTGPITVREIEGFRIRLKPSRVEPNQAYVIIELPQDFSFVPQTLFIYEETGSCRKHPLPAPMDAQIKTEIFLR
jgi:hypothetical protein